MRTINATSSRVWITIYDLAKLRHLDYGWVEACSTRDWRAGNYTCGSFYHVRGEVKNWNLSSNVYDTSMQINPQLKGAAVNVNTNVVVIRRGTNNYYWASGGDVGLAPQGKVLNCDMTPPPGTPMVDVSFANPTDKWAVVTIGDANPTGPSAGHPPVSGECVAAGQTKTWKLVAATEYIVNFYVREGSCTGRDVSVNGGRAKVNGNAVNVRMVYGLDQTR